MVYTRRKRTRDPILDWQRASLIARVSIFENGGVAFLESAQWRPSTSETSLCSNLRSLYPVTNSEDVDGSLFRNKGLLHTYMQVLIYGINSLAVTTAVVLHVSRGTLLAIEVLQSCGDSHTSHSHALLHTLLRHTTIYSKLMVRTD